MGLGHKFTVKEKHSVYIGISYKHQFVRFEYQTPDNKKYTEESGFDVIAFKIGFLL